MSKRSGRRCGAEKTTLGPLAIWISSPRADEDDQGDGGGHSGEPALPVTAIDELP
jgi:hypothetical protein